MFVITYDIVSNFSCLWLLLTVEIMPCSYACSDFGGCHHGLVTTSVDLLMHISCHVCIL